MQRSINVNFSHFKQQIVMWALARKLSRCVDLFANHFPPGNANRFLYPHAYSKNSDIKQRNPVRKCPVYCMCQ